MQKRAKENRQKTNFSRQITETIKWERENNEWKEKCGGKSPLR